MNVTRGSLFRFYIFRGEGLRILHQTMQTMDMCGDANKRMDGFFLFK
jgi:hypothetical protein